MFKNEYTIKNISKIVRLDRGSVRFVSTIEIHEILISKRYKYFVMLNNFFRGYMTAIFEIGKGYISRGGR